MASTDYYVLRLTEPERAWLLDLLYHRQTMEADGIYRKLCDSEPRDARVKMDETSLTSAPRTVVTANPEGNLPWPQIAEAVGPKYLPVGNATADPPGKHPHLASREQILERAEHLISHDRAQTYGDARESFKRIGLLWSDIIGTPITATDVARMMIAMKLSRLTRDPAHADSWVDIAGYAALGAEIAEVEL